MLFEIEQFEIHTIKYRIEAESEAQAIFKLFENEGDPVDDSLELIDICLDLGLPAQEYRELADELHSLGVTVGEHVIPSIRTIKRVESADTE